MVDSPRPLSVGSIISVRVNQTLLDVFLHDSMRLYTNDDPSSIGYSGSFYLFQNATEPNLFQRQIDENIMNSLGANIWPSAIRVDFGQGYVNVAYWNQASNSWVFI